MKIGSLLTEQGNPASRDIDSRSTAEILALINREDHLVAPAVAVEIPRIAQAVDAVVACILRGGRLYYIGAGTSGRLGVLDAAECPPTFHVPDDLVQGILAGGEAALARATEASEDDPEAGRRDLAARATQLNEFVVSHAPSFAQRAGETALLWGETALCEMLIRLKENRDFCLAALARMPGVTVPKPDGAFYLFPKISGMSDSFDFCKRLLMDTKVGLAPGVAFGAGGEGSVRICYAAERPILQEAMARLAGFMK